MNKRVLTLLLIWRFTDHYLSKLPKDVLKYLVKDMYWDYFTGVAYCEYKKLSLYDIQAFIGKPLYYCNKPVGSIIGVWYGNSNNNIVIYAKIRSDYKIIGLSVSYIMISGMNVPTNLSISVSEIPKDEICKQINYL